MMAENQRKIDPEYRGYITNRLLSSRLPPLQSDDYLKGLLKHGFSVVEDLGELDHLGMLPSELEGKTLDVGVGGARSLLQGVENGYDLCGVDLALAARVGGFHPGSRSMMKEGLALESLRKVMSQFPDKLIEADAAKEIPFPDNSFEDVIACISLPNYARDRDEAVQSVLEMVRVSKSKVAFVTGYPEIPLKGQMTRIGVGKKAFDFGLVDLLNNLEVLGIGLSWRLVPNKSESQPQNFVSAHLDVSGKDQEKLKSFRFP